jgi:hypothetical protein
MSALSIDRTQPHDAAASPPSTFAQLFCVFGGFFAWNAQQAANYALAAYPCFHAGLSRSAMSPGWEHSWFWLIAINLASVATTLIAIAVGLRAVNWAREHRSEDEPQPRVVARTRVMGIAGVMSGVLFLLATIFVLIAMLGTPRCSG